MRDFRVGDVVSSQYWCFEGIITEIKECSREGCFQLAIYFDVEEGMRSHFHTDTFDLISPVEERDDYSKVFKVGDRVYSEKWNRHGTVTEVGKCPEETCGQNEIVVESEDFYREDSKFRDCFHANDFDLIPEED